MRRPHSPATKSSRDSLGHPHAPCIEALEPRLLLTGDITVTVDRLATTDTTPQITGAIDDPLASILVRVNGANYVATNNGDTTWTLADDTVAALPNSTYDVVVVATHGNSFGIDDTTGELTIDTVPPVVTVNVLHTNDTTPALTGTISEPGAAVSVNVGGADYSAVNNGNGTWTLADNTITPALAPGTYEVIATATDAAGNVGTDATTDELEVALGPTVTVDELTTKNTSPSLTGTVSDPAAIITVTVVGADYTAVNNQDGTWRLAAGIIAPALTDGTYDVAVSALDLDGHTGTDATTDELVIDTVAPTVTVDALTTTDSRPPLSGTVNDPDATIAVRVNGHDYAAANNGDGTWTLADNTIAALIEGTYDVRASAVDPAGNLGQDATTDELVVDLAPVVTVDDLITNQDSPELTGTVNDPDATVLITIAGLTLTGAPYQADVDAEGKWTLSLGTITPHLADSAYNVIATARDAHGNEGTDATSNELTVDTVAPAVTIDPLTTDRTSPELTGTVDDHAATVVVTVQGKDYTATNNANGAWALARYSIKNLPAGTYTVNVVATDAAGNKGTNDGQVVVTVTAPAITINKLTTTNTSPQLAGTVDSADAEITIQVSGHNYTATITTNTDGSISWTLAAGTISPSLGTTTYDVRAWAKDAFDNYGDDDTLNELTVIPEQVVFLTRGVRGLVYHDPDGTRVVMQIKDIRDTSIVRLSFASDSVMSADPRGRWPVILSADAGATLSSLDVLGDTCTISFYTSGGHTPGATLGGITGSAHVTGLVAPGMTLIGDGLDMTGFIRSMTFASIQADVTMTGVADQPINITVARDISDANIRIVNSSIA